MATALPTLTAEDFTSDQEVRWCPGCGDFAILAQLKHTLAGLQLPRERIVFVSGIGCSSRLPYYLNVYGFHTIHGRAPSIASGLKIANPDLSVWVVTGDGDGLGAGAGQLLHALRRNVDIKVLLFNNEVYGLSKGQTSPTTRLNTRTRTSPHGSVELPLRPLALALAAGATFVARTVDVDGEHLARTLRQAADHRGSAFVEIYQNCKIFNDGVFEYASERGMKADNVIYLEHGQPLLFGKDRTQGLKLNGIELNSFDVAGPDDPDVLIHDERSAAPALAQLLAEATSPALPECLGVVRQITRPTWESHYVHDAAASDTLTDLLTTSDTWEVAAV